VTRSEVRAHPVIWRESRASGKRRSGTPPLIDHRGCEAIRTIKDRSSDSASCLVRLVGELFDDPTEAAVDLCDLVWVEGSVAVMHAMGFERCGGLVIG
jgi:hypothetical protein